MNIDDKLVERLKKFARKECYHDNDDDSKCIDDYAGGNVDDAFSEGEHSGEVMLARDILTHMGISWSVDQ